VGLEKSYDSKTVAEYLAVSERRVRELCLRGDRGDINGLRGWKLGKEWRVTESTLREFVEARAKRAAF
jgi:excisionase family DNA binding protein